MFRAFLAAFAVLIAQVAPAASQYPERRITIVVPNAAGSATDAIARMIGQELAARLGQPVIVENKPGANTQIGAEYVVNAKPDGYTLFLTTHTSQAANVSLVKNLKYDPIKDFTSIVKLGTAASAVLVHNRHSAKDIPDFARVVKANPGKFSYGYAQSSSQIVSEVFKRRFALDMIAVPYTSTPRALNDIIGGQIDMYVADVNSARTAAQSNNVQILAVTSAGASRYFPGVPPMAKYIPGLEVVAWFGLFGPAGMPPEIVSRLEREAKAIVTDSALKDRIDALGVDIEVSQSSAEFTAFVGQEIKRWGELVKETGIEAQ